MELQPIRFISTGIEVHYKRPPVLEKKPGCPDSFTWENQTFQIVEILSEWHDYKRRGRMGRNMQPQHASRASKRGSWGVGADYYRVRTRSGRVFDIYFDRAPKDVDRRKGSWYLFQELAIPEEGKPNHR